MAAPKTIAAAFLLVALTAVIGQAAADGLSHSTHVASRALPSSAPGGSMSVVYISPVLSLSLFGQS